MFDLTSLLLLSCRGCGGGLGDLWSSETLSHSVRVFGTTLSRRIDQVQAMALAVTYKVSNLAE